MSATETKHGIADGVRRTIHAGYPVEATRDGKTTTLAIGDESVELVQRSRYRYAIKRRGKIVHEFVTATHRSFAEYMAARWLREELMIDPEPPALLTTRGRYGR